MNEQTDNNLPETEASYAPEGREAKMLSDGVERYRASQSRLHLAERDVSKRLLKDIIVDVTNGLHNYLQKCRQARGSNPKIIEDGDFDEPMELGQIAQLTIMAAIDGFDKQWPRSSLIMNIGKMVACLRFETVMSKGNRKERRMATDMGRKVDSGYGDGADRADYYFKLAERHGFTWEYYTDTKKREIGSVCVAVLLESCPEIFTDVLLKLDPDQDHEMNYVILTDKAQAEMTELMEQLESMSHTFAPMDRLPRPWSLTSIGPYETPSLAANVDLVRNPSPDQRKDIKEAMINGQMDQCIEALNVLQDVPYEVNPYIVDAVEWVKDNGKGHSLSKFPNIDPVAIPAKLADNDYDKQSPLNKKLLAEKRVKAIADDKLAKSDAKQMNRNIKEARYWQETGKFYMPHNFDTRGRIYHVSDFGHHNTDYLRAMLLFHNKEPIDSENVAYLALQLANSWGNGKDKLSLEGRQKWAKDNEDQIAASGRDFIANFDFWSQADEPFTFLAGCHEYANYLEHGEGYLSGLPVGLDATNSGIQHFAAASLNREDGELVNLTKNDEPQDMYVKCMNYSIELMKADIAYKREAQRENPANDNDTDAEKRSKLQRDRQIHAANLLLDEKGEYRIRREHLKSNVMTFCYSSRKFGFAKQLRSKIFDPITRKANREGKPHPFGRDNGFTASHYLAGINEYAIKKAVKSASDGMDFFQRCSGLLALEGKHLKFVSPLGFPMHQYYREWKKGKQKVPLYKTDTGKIEKGQEVYYRKYTDKIDFKKSKQAVAANIVHCLDATHLMMTVLRAKDVGITDVMVVHDSFSTTIAGTKRLAYEIRKAFYDLYDGYCVYTDLLQQVIEQLDDPASCDLPPIPAKGDLDLTEVLESDYNFS